MTSPRATDPIAAADARLGWSGRSLALIRERWHDERAVLDLCGENRIRPDQQHAVLEQLRAARADVHYLLLLIDTVQP